MYWQIQKIATGLNITPTQLCADLLVGILNQQGVYYKGYETPTLYKAFLISTILISACMNLLIL